MISKLEVLKNFMVPIPHRRSALLCLQMMFSFMLTDRDSTLKACKHRNKIFAASRPNAEFCSPQCQNRYNVYKSRGKE